MKCPMQKLHAKLVYFSWDHEFKILRGGPFSAILGLDFMNRTRMLLYMAFRKFSLGFAPKCGGTFSLDNLDVSDEVYLQHLLEAALKIVPLSETWPGEVGSNFLVIEFWGLFSSLLGWLIVPLMRLNCLTPLQPVRHPIRVPCPR